MTSELPGDESQVLALPLQTLDNVNKAILVTLTSALARLVSRNPFSRVMVLRQPLMRATVRGEEGGVPAAAAHSAAAGHV